jgi:hypothetical protein
MIELQRTEILSLHASACHQTAYRLTFHQRFVTTFSPLTAASHHSSHSVRVALAAPTSKLLPLQAPRYGGK